MDPADPPPKKYEFKPKEFERVNAPPGSSVGKSTEHDVFAILQQNRAIEQRKGLGEIEIKKVRSRRKRDYWLLLIPSVLLLGVITWQSRSNPFFLVCGLTGIVVVALGLTWIMWHVMDDY